MGSVFVWNVLLITGKAVQLNMEEYMGEGMGGYVAIFFLFHSV